MRLVFLVVVSVICVSASFGAKLRPEVEQEVSLQQPGSFCQGCRSIVSFMSRFNSSTRRQENKELFGKFCDTYYPVSTDFRLGPCPMFVEGFFTILDRIDPVNQCDEIGACGTNYLPTQAISPSMKDNLVGPQGAICDVCTDIINQVKVHLEDPRLIDNIHHKVDAFCEYLTVIDADKQCRTALESYIDQALEFIKTVKPRDLCRSLKFCPAGSPAVGRIVSSSSKKEQHKNMPTLADFNDFGIETSVQVGGQQVKSLDEMPNDVGIGSPNCLFCKTFVKELFKFLKENRTEENIRNALDHGCDLIYHNRKGRDHCEDLVKSYTKELLELLVDETNPEMICMLLGQCTFQTLLPTQSAKTLGQSSRRPSSSSTDKPISMSELISMLDPTIQVNSMRTCVECKLFIKYLQETLQEPSSQEEIKNYLLNNLCANLGDVNLADSCTKFINQESAVFFKAIVESLDPKKSCEQLGACSARIRSDYVTQLQQQFATYRELNPTGVLVKRPSMLTDKPLCDQCTTIVTKIDAYLSSHPIDHDISVLKDKVCNTIQDDNLRGECVMIIQTLGQEIIQAISNMDNPRQLCQKIALCSVSY